jgi:hypothetical protein
MGNRQVVPLLYGAGIDRATGVHSVEGRAGRDLRNVYLYRDKAQVRHGHSNVNLLVDEHGNPLEAGVLVSPMSAEQIGLVAGYGSDGRVHLFRVGGDGKGLASIGVAFTLAGGAHTPPRLLAAEQYNKMFVAHDEADQGLRAPTVYYDPFGAPLLNTLSADLDGDGTPGNVLFRGVAPYLTYLVGWGHGTETDPDHPETVRVSDPEDPTSLSPDDYFNAGTGGTPVLTCLPAGPADSPVCLVLKPSEIYKIVGYSKETFGILPVESGFGVASSRLAYSLGGVVYFWDPSEGPRRSSGGPSEDLGWPLDLNAPSPADLVAAGALADGFVCYLPVRRCLLFVFGQRVYVLNLWDPSALKWSYGELPFVAQSGGVLAVGVDAPTAPPVSAAGSVVLSNPTDTSLHVAWVNAVDHPLIGGEVAEVWMHAITADTWTIGAQVIASGPNQSTDLLALNPGTDYEAQVRYRRGPYYRADYESGDPSSWPSGSLSNTEATTIAAPVLSSALWSRVSAILEQVALVWAGNPNVESLIYRDAVLIGTVPALGSGAPPTSGLLTVPTFAMGTTNTDVAYTGCIYVLSPTQYTLPASATAGVPLPAGTILATKWGAFLVTVDATLTVTFTPAPDSFGPGYAREIDALNVLPTVPTGSVLLTKITMQAQPGNPWISGTDALHGGSGGNPAQATNFYPGSSIVPGYADRTIAGETSYVYTVTQKGADHESLPSKQITTWTGPFPGPTSFSAIPGEVRICAQSYYAIWGTTNPDLCEVAFADESTGIYFRDRADAVNSISGDAIGTDEGGPIIPEPSIGVVIDLRVRHIETAFGVEDFSPAIVWNLSTFTADPC